MTEGLTSTSQDPPSTSRIPIPTSKPRLGPRKSSIRSKPPQIFQSPTGMTRSPLRQQSPLASPTQARPPALHARHTISSNTWRPAAKKRRVTFSTRQERTDFMRDEPTMHIRPGIETDMTGHSHSGSSLEAEDSLIPALNEYSDEDSSSSEEEDTQVDMDLTYNHNQTVEDDGEDRTMDLTAAIASIDERRDNSKDESEGEESMQFTQIHCDIDTSQEMDLTGAQLDDQSISEDSDASQLMDLTNNTPTSSVRTSAMDLTNTSTAAMDLTNNNSTAAMDLTNTSTAAMDLTNNNSTAAMDLTNNNSTAAMDLTRGETSEMDMDLTHQHQSPTPVEILPQKSKLRARDSMAALTNFAKRNRSRPSYVENTASPAANRRQSEVDTLSSSVRRQSEVDTVSPSIGRQSEANTVSPSIRRQSEANTVSPSIRRQSEANTVSSATIPATPSRFRRSLVGGMTQSPSKSPARRIHHSTNTGTSTSTSTSTGTGTRSGTNTGTGTSGVEGVSSASARKSIVAQVLPQKDPVSQPQEEEEEEEEEDWSDPDRLSPSLPGPPNLTLSEFFSLSGLNFHDDTKAIKVRVLPPTQHTAAHVDDPLYVADLNSLRFKAMAGSVPMLSTLSQACRELKRSVAEGGVVLKELEDKFIESPPDLVRELLNLSDETEKKEMESQFKLQKQAARAIAKEGYLGWCLDNQYGQDTVALLTDTKNALSADLDRMTAEAQSMTEDIVPTLQTRRDLLQDQVERLKSRQAEIDRTPVSDLESLHQGMQELLPELQSRRLTQVEKQESLDRLTSKLGENEVKEKKLMQDIESSRLRLNQLQKGSIWSVKEVTRLSNWIGTVSSMHGWSIISVSPQAMLLQFDTVFDVDISLSATTGSVENVHLSTRASSILVEQVISILNQEFKLVQDELQSQSLSDSDQSAIQLGQLIRHISVIWISIRELVKEVQGLNFHYPTSILPSNEENFITLQVDLLLRESRSKVVIGVEVDLETLMYDSSTRCIYLDDLISADSDSVVVKKVYGNVQSHQVERIKDEIVGRCQRGEKRRRLGDGVLGRIVFEVVGLVDGD
ncbi:unnamed protein product [Sympodiomycopsis kandeliae]